MFDAADNTTKAKAVEDFNNVLYALVLAFSFEAFEKHSIVSVQFILAVALLLNTVDNYLSNYQYFVETKGLRFDESILLFNLIHLVFVYKSFDYLKTEDIKALGGPGLWLSGMALYLNSFLHSLRTRQRPFWRLTLLRFIVILFLFVGMLVFGGRFGDLSNGPVYLIYAVVTLLFTVVIVVPRAFRRGLKIFYSENLELQVVESISKIDRATWDAIRDPNNSLTDFDFLRAVEETRVIECQFRYFLFRRSGSLICSMAGYSVVNDFAMFGGKFSKRLVIMIRRIAPDFLKFRTLEIGSPVGLGTTISAVGEMTESMYYSALNQVKEYSRTSDLRLVLIREFNESTHSIETAMKSSGFRQAMMMPQARLPVRWKSFDEYLHSLQKTYRHNCKKKQKRKDDFGVKTIVVTDPSSFIDSYVELYTKTREHSDQFTREFIGRPYHVSMHKNFSGHSFWLQYEFEGRLIAFVHLVKYKRRLISQFIGLNYKESQEALIYFNTYYDIIKIAIENDIEMIEVGITAYEAKSEVGFSIVPQRMYAWHKSKVISWLLVTCFNLITDYDVKRCHSVFQDSTGQYLWDGSNPTSTK